MSYSGLDFDAALLTNYNVQIMILCYLLQYHIGVAQIGKYPIFI